MKLRFLYYCSNLCLCVFSTLMAMAVDPIYRCYYFLYIILLKVEHWQQNTVLSGWLSQDAHTKHKYIILRIQIDDYRYILPDSEVKMYHEH